MKSKLMLVLLGALISVLLVACADLQAMVAQGQATGLPDSVQEMPVGSAITNTQTATLGTLLTTTPGTQITLTLPIAPGPSGSVTQTVTPSMTTPRTITPHTTIRLTGTVTTPQTVTPQYPPSTLGQPPNTLNLDDLNSPDQLDSYSSTTLVTFTPDTGQKVVFDVLTEAMAVTSTAVQNDADLGREMIRHWVITLTQGSDQMGAVEFVTADDRSWVRVNNEWAETQILPEQLLNEVGWVGSPNNLIDEKAQARFIRKEILGGQDTWVYRLGFNDMQETEGFIELENGEATLWISPQYMLPLRTSVRAVGNSVRFGTGTVDSVSTLTAVNVPVQFPLPPDLVTAPTPASGTPSAAPVARQTPLVTPLAPGATATSTAQPELLSINGLPIMQGAVNIRAVDNVVIYNINQSPPSVIAFYSNLPSDTGWTLADTQPAEDIAVTLVKSGATAKIVAVSGQTSDQTIVVIAIN